MTANPQTNFPTPNPEELKKAAQTDPIHQREGAQETDVIDKSADEEASEQFGREASVDMANSQTTIANLGGH